MRFFSEENNFIISWATCSQNMNLTFRATLFLFFLIYIYLFNKVKRCMIWSSKYFKAIYIYIYIYIYILSLKNRIVGNFIFQIIEHPWILLLNQSKLQRPAPSHVTCHKRDAIHVYYPQLTWRCGMCNHVIAKL